MSERQQTGLVLPEYVLLESPHRPGSQSGSIQGTHGRYYGAPQGLAAAASSAAAATNPPSRQEGPPAPLNTAPPTLQQRFALTAMPAAMVSSGSRSARKGKGNRKKALARDGQVFSQQFDALGRRPYPTNGISLEQSITVELSVSLGNFIASSSTIGVMTYAAQAFSISQFSGATSLLSVFDQYKIEQIEVWVQYNAPNLTLGYPELATAVDLDDANVPTQFGQVADHQGSLLGSSPAGRYHKWRPHMAVAAYSGAFTSYSNVVATWIDSASPNVQHYGLKAAITSSNATVVYTVLDVRAVVSFRAPAIN